VLQVGDVVKFYDYDYAIKHRDAGGDKWRIGVVSEIRDEPWDEDWDKECLPLVVVVHNGHSQPLVMPNKNNLGTWVEIISRA
jgi:hypothetical protein|tara:strand:- start:187 stop:432 length:246 start_codon:yes stop_codon:yes gene_type:complete